MGNAAGRLIVTGNASFDGADHNGWLTLGTLELRGNFSQAATFSTQSFYPTGSHLTQFSGTAAQTITFAAPGAAGSASHLHSMLNTNGSGGVSLGSSVFLSGNLTQSGILTVGVGRTLTIAGTLTLSAGSTTTVAGVLSAGSCTNQGGALSGFTCP